ncbi:MAG: DNA repair protein RadC [Clostridia bacterium]|nr:DNA repair protein RadC [Clostridia bacterium]
MENKDTKINNPHQHHRARVRETFKKAGVDGMPDHNLLELLLFYSIPRKDTNELAHRLIETFGSLNGVFDASYEQLIEVEGMGESSALLLSLVPGICRRYIEGMTDKKKINLSTPEAAKEYIVKKYYGCKNEVFYMLCLDSAGNLINCCKLSEGSSGTVVVDKRIMLEAAMRNKADKVVFAHNHPNGVAAPSKDDLELTYEFSSILSNIGIRATDHLIVSGDDVLSLVSVEKFKTLFL